LCISPVGHALSNLAVTGVEPAGMAFAIRLNTTAISNHQGLVTIINGPAVVPTGGMIASSPFEMPATQSSKLALREEFIKWCKAQPHWYGEGHHLDRMLLIFDEHGFDVQGIAKATSALWKDAGLGCGYRIRIQKALKQWLRRRGESVGGGSGSEGEVIEALDLT
jgi:hypothetical protein